MLAVGSLTVSLAATAVAPATIARPAPSTDPAKIVTSRPDLVSAGMVARAQHQRVEVTSLDTSSSTTYVNPGGTVTTEFSSQPFQARDASGDWKPVDGTLREQADGSIKPAVSPLLVAFGKNGTSSAAELGEGTRSVGLGWQSALPAPTLSGDTADYANVLPGTDLTAQATASGFELSLVVKSRPTAPLPASIALPLSGSGVTWSLSSEHVLVGRDRAGQTVVTSAGARAWDATTDPHTHLPSRVTPLGLSLTGAAGAQVLHVALPTALLADPATVFPVTVDPSASWSSVAWTYVDSGNPTTSYYNATGAAPIGTANGGVNVDRSLFQFNTGNLNGKHILSATLTLNETGSYSCTAEPFSIYGDPAFTSATTWNTQPAVGTLQATVTAAKGFSAACPAGNVTADVTGWAQNATADTNPHYLELRAGSETVNDFWKSFASTATVAVTYNSYPSFPFAGSMSPCGAPCSWNGGAWTNTATPQFTSYASDADNDPMRFDYEVWAGTSPTPTTLVASGSVSGVMSFSPATWTVPAGALTNGGTYELRARTFDGTDYSPWLSTAIGWAIFTVDTTPPATPSLSSTAWTAGAWTAPTSGSVSWSDTSTDVTTYSYQVDGGTWSAQSSATSATLSGLANNTVHTVNVTATDRAGNQSPVGAFTFGVGTGGLTSPADQARTQANVTLAAAGPSGYPYVYYQWRQGSTGTWSTVPVGDVTLPGTNTHPSTWPVVAIGGSYVWNLANTVTQSGGSDGVVQMQACLSALADGSSPICQGSPVTIQLAAHAFGDSYATQQVGPGTVSLLTGDYSISSTDVNITAYRGALSIDRGFTTLAPPAANATATGIFGPGWTASLTGPSAGAAGMTATVATDKSFIVLTDATGTQRDYQATTALTTSPISYTGVGDAHDGSTLSYAYAASPATITLTDTTGTQTTWQSIGGAWVPASVQETGTQANSQSSWAYGTSGLSTGLPTMLVAPTPANLLANNAPCTPVNATTTPGCRSLTFDYQSVTVGTSSVTRLADVNLVAYDPGTSAMRIVQVAAYDYDGTGRLAHAWDPRITPALKTSYSYDGNGRLSTLTPPGQAAWSFGYNTTGQLSTVSRPDPANGTATTTIVYQVPFTGTGAPVELGASTTAAWGQTSDVPADKAAAAVFPPDHVPAGTTPATVASADWPYASLTYLDVNGRAVNTANYGAGAWQITATRYDQYGNTITTLTAGNRAQAVTPTGATDPGAAALTSSAARAALLSTSNVYSADRTELLDTFGPIHPVQLSDGTKVDARSHTHTVYDEGAPTGGPYLLPTTTVTSAQTSDGVDHDPVTAHIGYNPINTGDTSGWTLRQPTTSTVQLGTSPSTSDLVTTTRYDPNGQVIESRLPAGPSGADAHSTITTYYSASGSGTCVSAAYAGLVCSVGPVAQPSTGNPLPVSTFSYGLYGQLLTKTETAGSTVRTTTATYDAGQRLVSSSTVVTPAASGGTALPTVIYGYDPNTGLPATRSTTSGTTTTTLTTGYDSVGRATTYTDAAGAVSTTGYDIDGRPTTVNDGKGTYTYTYDSTTEHRGVITGLNVGVSPSPSAFSATYDPDGRVASETYPTGLVRSSSADNSGNTIALTYAKGTTQWMQFTQIPNAQGKAAHQSSPFSVQNITYDGAGRLTNVTDNVLSQVTWTVQCTTRAYTFDADSNRSQLAAYPDDNTSPSSGHCTTATTPAVTSSTFDQADRLTNTGYTYDTLGRTTTVPAGDAISIGNASWVTGNLTMGYYSNDMLALEGQGGQGINFQLDPTQNRVTGMTYAGTSWVNHFRDDSDSPSWQSVSNGTWTRNITGIDGGLAATVDQTGSVILALPNLHGDIVATSADDPAATGVNSYTESTEYGAPRYPTYSYSVYGWLGAEQRSSQNLGGLVTMGVRMYNPATGRFLSNDPISGGNSNAYVYPVDPVGESDTNGKSGGPACKAHNGYLYCHTRYYGWVVVMYVGYGWNTDSCGSENFCRAAKYLYKHAASCIANPAECADKIEVYLSVAVLAGSTLAFDSAYFAICAGSWGIGCITGGLYFAAVTAVGGYAAYQLANCVYTRRKC